MTTWISIAVIGWVVLSVVVSLAVGGMIRRADSRQPAGPTRGQLRHLRAQPVATTAVTADVATGEQLQRVS